MEYEGLPGTEERTGISQKSVVKHLNPKGRLMKFSLNYS